MPTTQQLQDELEEWLVTATTDGHQQPGQKRLALIHSHCFELQQRAFEGSAPTVRRRSRIWDPVPDTQAGFGYGREDYQFLPDLNTRRLHRNGSYAGKGLRVF